MGEPERVPVLKGSCSGAVQRWGLKNCAFPWNGNLGVPGSLHLPRLLQGQKSGSGEGEGNFFCLPACGKVLK